MDRHVLVSLAPQVLTEAMAEWLSTGGDEVVVCGRDGAIPRGRFDIAIVSEARPGIDARWVIIVGGEPEDVAGPPRSAPEPTPDLGASVLRLGSFGELAQTLHDLAAPPDG